MVVITVVRDAISIGINFIITDATIKNCSTVTGIAIIRNTIVISVNSVIASAIRPSSTENTNVFPMLRGDKNAGLSDQNTTISTNKRMNGPNSGLAINLRIVDPLLTR